MAQICFQIMAYIWVKTKQDDIYFWAKYFSQTTWQVWCKRKRVPPTGSVFMGHILHSICCINLWPVTSFDLIFTCSHVITSVNQDAPAQICCIIFELDLYSWNLKNIVEDGVFKSWLLKEYNCIFSHKF